MSATEIQGLPDCEAEAPSHTRMQHSLHVPSLITCLLSQHLKDFVAKAALFVSMLPNTPKMAWESRIPDINEQEAELLDEMLRVSSFRSDRQCANKVPATPADLY